MNKPLDRWLHGRPSSRGRLMGQSSAIIVGREGTRDWKLSCIADCGIKVTRNPSEMGRLLKGVL